MFPAKETKKKFELVK